VKAMLWKTSPAATELEQLVTDWLRQMLGLSDGWFGITTDTASISSMLSLAAARESRPELAVRERGMAGRDDLPRLRVYASEHVHSSVDKGALALGIGLENVVKIAADDEFRMRPDALAAAIAADRSLGYLPLACVATVGTTSTSSIDPVPAIAEICRRENVWLHVDGAYGGMLSIVPEFRSILDGVESADSLVVNPHKWLFTPAECSVLFLKRPEVLKRAFSLVPEYLVTREQDEVVNYMDYGVQLGRRFRALKLWMGGFERRLGAHGARSIFPCLFPLRTARHERSGMRSAQRSDHARRERRRRCVPVTHQAARPFHFSPGDRKHSYGGTSRRAGVAAAKGSSGLMTVELADYSCAADFSVYIAGNSFFRFTTFGASLILM
jgi:aromatic-L-amino-acid/L-tryptophan decarboxylase